MGKHVLFVRHGLSGSNAQDNSGVHYLHSRLTTRVVEERWAAQNLLHQSKIGMGREYVETTLREDLSSRTKPDVIIVSPLTRAVQTLLLAASEEVLRETTIKMHPKFVEQTHWFSDMIGSLEVLKAIIFETMQVRGFEFKLNIDWTEMGSDDDDADWKLKTGLWATKNVTARGKEAVNILRNIRHDTIWLFGHGGFIKQMTEDGGDIDVHSIPPRLTDLTPGQVILYTFEPGIDLMVQVVDNGSYYVDPDATAKREALRKCIVALEQNEPNPLYEEARRFGRIPDSVETGEHQFNRLLGTAVLGDDSLPI